ncbi:MAG: bifunctional diaminohydroxyphosphoribosylaminopyrimidine deaminase/5-amino-6-(5-phosphoribosylamino)uracil reductase RibD [Vicinamibacterales bacterium]|nr:bifunctional diaminohydroxyphosphoribosylaminopyrimidine deaminase/5-amino-6-(5-phosphoribosylamino)uracil reductase RibD [Vicinamibacterales bacterium]
MLSDAAYMERALLLAGRARGRTTPNPLVGAVVVTPDGVVAGAGCHERAGEPHAEIHALREAGAAARGATLYCTLEPCSHVGRTPPCVERILESGVARVVAAVEDPNPLVAGRGFLRLRQAGVIVDVGAGDAAARRLNRPFFSAMRRGRPYVIVKAVTSLDGRVAAAGGGPARLSSSATDRRTHALRAEVDAIAVGSGTMLADDPLLTVRGVFRGRPLTRVVFDRRLRTRASARVFSTLDAGPIVIVAGPGAPAGAARALESAGAHVVAAPGGLTDALRLLLPMGVQSVLVEGGPAVHAALWREGAADAVRLVVAPRALGEAGVPWVERAVAPWASWRHLAVEPSGGDVIIEADVHWTD